MKRAVEVLASARASRRIAVLGEMLELGDHAAELHAGVGRFVAGAGIDRLLTVGGAPAAALSEAAVESGMPRDRARHFATSELAADAIAGEVRSGDVVLVKGSRGVKTDRVVDRLKAERA